MTPASPNVKALWDTLRRGGGGGETMPLGEINLTKDDSSKANVTLDDDEEGSVSLLSQYDSFSKRLEECDKRLGSVEGRTEVIERSVDDIKSNFDANVYNSPAMKDITRRLEAIESARRPKKEELIIPQLNLLFR